MLLRVLALSVALVSVAHADDGDQPPWEIRIGAGVGGGRMAMLGNTYRGPAVSIDVDVLHQITPETAVGLYLGELIAEPWTTVKAADGKSIFRELAFEIEPQVAHRRVRALGPHVGAGWEVTGSAGVVLARTYESCHSIYSHHGCAILLEKSTELGVTTGINGFVYAGPVIFDVGARAQADTAGDAAIVLQGSAGAIF